MTPIVTILISVLLSAVIGVTVVFITRQLLEKSNRRIEAQSEENFSRLSAQVLEQQRSSMVNENRRDIGMMLEPLKNQIEAFNNELRGTTRQQRDSQQQMKGEIEMLVRLNRSIGEEASRLSQALRGNSQVRGSWGEQILETMLEKAGLKKDVNYTVQQTRDELGRALKDTTGRGRRPDLVLNIPGERKIIVDSKVSLNAYVDFMNAEDDTDKKAAARRLVDSFKRHLDEIKNADYPAVIEGSCELVVMFMPNEGAYFTAIECFPGLWEYAYERNIMLATPTHFFSIVQLVARMWRQDAQNRNAAEIGAAAGELYDKIVELTKKFELVGQRLDQAQDAYKKSLNAMRRGKTSVTGLAENVKKLGASTNLSIPDKFIEEEEDIAATDD